VFVFPQDNSNIFFAISFISFCNACFLSTTHFVIFFIKFAPQTLWSSLLSGHSFVGEWIHKNPVTFFATHSKLQANFDILEFIHFTKLSIRFAPQL
jgi:hypothetical protein